LKKKAERAAFIEQRLRELYPQPPIPLQHNSIFELLVAVLLSAQCTDARVNLVTPALFARANTAKAMARIPVAEIQEYGGEVPADMDALETLPGVGHKTASVVMSQGFGEPAFPVDTHIHRLAQRWGLTNGKNVVQTERDLKRLFARESWNDLHLQIIYYGREFCSARGCDGTVCDICRTCYPERVRAKSTRKA
jgi:endonuclease-3